MASTSRTRAPISSWRSLLKLRVNSPCATVVTAAVSSRRGWLTRLRSSQNRPPPRPSTASTITPQTQAMVARWLAMASRSDTSATTHQPWFLTT